MGVSFLPDWLARTRDFLTVRGGIVRGPVAFVDRNQRVALKVHRDGSVLIPALIGRSGGGSSTDVLKVVLAVMLGQSNAEGRARPVSPRLDPQDTRIRMYDWATDSLKLATVPLSTPQQQLGLSPATQIARRFVAESANTVAVVLNAGVGSSGLVTNPVQGSWKVGYTGTNPALYAQAVTALQRTISLIQTTYGIVPEVWVYWHQGEADSTVSTATYAAALDTLISSLRGTLGDPTIPFTAGGMVPERIEAIPTSANVRAALMGIPARNTFAAYTDGIPNGGGSENADDITHYTRQGAIALGNAMFEASLRAATSSADQIPHKPLRVQAVHAGSTLLASWSEPDTRFTSFTVEYRVDGGSWVSGTTADTKITFTGITGTAVEVRVTSRNGAVASQPTIPVLAS